MGDLSALDFDGVLCDSCGESSQSALKWRFGVYRVLPLTDSEVTPEMKGGRRNLKQGALNGCPEPQPGESLMRVVSLRGSNLIEVEDSDGAKTLCMLPAKFRKSLWIKTGSYVLVEEGDREKAADAGNKVTGTIVQVLYEEHVRALRKTSFWPPAFVDISGKAHIVVEGPAMEDALKVSVEHYGDDIGSDDDEDGLPPLEANRNRQQPTHLWHTAGSDTEDNDDE